MKILMLLKLATNNIKFFLTQKINRIIIDLMKFRGIETDVVIIL